MDVQLRSRFLGGNMFRGIGFESESESIEKFRISARKMPNEQLIREGKMLRDLCKGPQPPDIWLQQLEILRDEWRRRHPKTS
jgi:hypothetical protein